MFHVSTLCLGDVFNPLSVTFPAVTLFFAGITRLKCVCVHVLLLSIVRNSSALLTVATRPVEAVHGSVLRFPVRELQRGVQTPEAFSQGVVFVVFNQLLNTHRYRYK